MRIMFVCTGNICRSPMGELLMSHYLTGTTVQVSSAGTRGLPMHPIDPSSGRLMDSVGIESSGFHSRRLTRQMADDADLKSSSARTSSRWHQPRCATRSC